MGNSQSNDNPPPLRSAAALSAAGRRERERDGSRGGSRDGARKVPSSHVGVGRNTPPTVAHLVAQSSASTSTSNATAHADLSASSLANSSSQSSYHSRARSINSSTSGRRTGKADEGGVASSHKSESAAVMGNSESREQRHRPPSRSATLPPPAVEKGGHPSPLSHPVDVPQPTSHDGLNENEDLTPPSTSPFGLPASQLSRPPRLPLPIEREPEPGSPIIGAQDFVAALEAPLGNEALDNNEEGAYLPRRQSLLSSTTLDDEDAADIEQFAVESNPFAQKVATLLQWQGDAKTVYATGTFAGWEKKFRMTRQPDGVTYTVTIPLAVGTHHITFMVDGEPKTSREMPTTVDFTNTLVNYIEVIAPESPTEERQDPISPPAEPMPIPGAPQEHADILDSLREPGTAIPIRAKDQPVPETGDELSQTLQETIAEEQPIVTELQPAEPAAKSPEATTQTSQTQKPQQKTATATKKRLPRPKYTNDIPELLLHLDLYSNPDDERYRRASKAVQHLPHPPTLPMFMSKSILNTATPHKDDASVLAMPNHTVLNHLATSSIRNGVLATSGTTRYKRKFLTTIMYKPTYDDA